MTAPFYAAIATHYDDIFPLDCEMGDFLARRLPRGTVLDIGCATGTMALHLATFGCAVHGIDLDPAMIAAAAARARAAGLPATFAVRDMRDLAAVGAAGSFSGAYCVGNTLVHLDSSAEIGALLAAAAGLVRPGGVLALQIINYDRVLDCGVTELPVRDNERLRFERRYRGDGDRIRFLTRLTLKADGRVLENDIPLFPLRAAALTGLLAAAGFTAVQLFADFAGAPWSPDGYLTVALARR